MDKKLRIDSLKPDARPGSPWMRAFIADCYDLLSGQETKIAERPYAPEFAKRPTDSASEASK